MPLKKQNNSGILVESAQYPSTDRGANAVDLVQERTNPDAVAKGINSALIGGENNTAIGKDCVVVGGRNNLAGGVLAAGFEEFSGDASVVIAGLDCVNTGQYNLVGGLRCRATGGTGQAGLIFGRDCNTKKIDFSDASGISYFIMAGDNCRMVAETSIVVGHDCVAGGNAYNSGYTDFTGHASAKFAAVFGAENVACSQRNLVHGFWGQARLTGEYVHANGSYSATAGETPAGTISNGQQQSVGVFKSDGQFTRNILGIVTSGATGTKLKFEFLGSGGGTTKYNLVDNTSYLVDVRILGRKIGGSGNADYSIHNRFAITQVGTADPAIVNSHAIGTTYNPGTWIATPPAYSIDTTNDALEITVTGVAATTINWLAVVEVLMVTG